MTERISGRFSVKGSGAVQEEDAHSGLGRVRHHRGGVGCHRIATALGTHRGRPCCDCSPGCGSASGEQSLSPGDTRGTDLADYSLGASSGPSGVARRAGDRGSLYGEVRLHRGDCRTLGDPFPANRWNTFQLWVNPGGREAAHCVCKPSEHSPRLCATASVQWSPTANHGRIRGCADRREP
jgi:hypothetical protein